MDNRRQAPVIPAGVLANGGPAYDPLQASMQAASVGQAVNLPDGGNVAGNAPATNEAVPSSETSTFAELAAKKGFQSPEDLAKAYLELESQNKRVEMGLAEMVKLRQEPQQQSLEQPVKVETEQDAIKVVENIVRRFTRPLEDQLALQNLFLRNPDASQYSEQMGKIIRKSPNMSWEDAYKVAKFDALGTKAKEEGKKEAYQAIVNKQTMVAGVSQPSVKEVRPVDDLIRDKNIPFVEVQRIMRERFSQ